ncbi:unnamed protein product [Brassica oleracea]|uniref:Uncharacterized protein n=1 Tax=Brassica oleracea TaxID=3712 RepID=A0A3P6AYN0_BRAOL|nr:unnamed protein product [Brassica oleracea]
MVVNGKWLSLSSPRQLLHNPPQNNSELSSNAQPNYNGTMFLGWRLG